MNHILKRTLACLISSLFISAQASAQNTSYLGLENLAKSGGAEFISGNQPGTVLMKVNLWGAVNRPGIHHVPIRTDLMSLMSYAGGPTGKAILDKVTIKRETENTRKLIKVDVEELIQGESHYNVELAPNDIIVIPTDEPLISSDTLAVVSLVSLVMSTILAAVYIERRRN
jgi:NADH:ubiquinone oxidoreductase subunit F (NADH-binding)